MFRHSVMAACAGLVHSDELNPPPTTLHPQPLPIQFSPVPSTPTAVFVFQTVWVESGQGMLDHLLNILGSLDGGCSLSTCYCVFPFEQSPTSRCSIWKSLWYSSPQERAHFLHNWEKHAIVALMLKASEHSRHVPCKGLRWCRQTALHRDAQLLPDMAVPLNISHSEWHSGSTSHQSAFTFTVWHGSLSNTNQHLLAAPLQLCLECFVWLLNTSQLVVHQKLCFITLNTLFYSVSLPIQISWGMQAIEKAVKIVSISFTFCSLLCVQRHELSPTNVIAASWFVLEFGRRNLEICSARRSQIMCVCDFRVWRGEQCLSVCAVHFMNCWQ